MDRSRFILSILITIFIAFLLYNQKRTEINLIKKEGIERINKKLKLIKPTIENSTKLQLSNAILENSKVYNIPENDLISIAYVESNFNPSAINKSGDYGIAQINAKIWKNYFSTNEFRLLNIYHNIEIACKIINLNKDRGNNDISFYHSSTKSKRKAYKQKLERILALLNRDDENS